MFCADGRAGGFTALGITRVGQALDHGRDCEKMRLSTGMCLDRQCGAKHMSPGDTAFQGSYKIPSEEGGSLAAQWFCTRPVCQSRHCILVGHCTPRQPAWTAMAEQ